LKEYIHFRISDEKLATMTVRSAEAVIESGQDVREKESLADKVDNELLATFFEEEKEEENNTEQRYFLKVHFLFILKH